MSGVSEMPELAERTWRSTFPQDFVRKEELLQVIRANAIIVETG